MDLSRIGQETTTKKANKPNDRMSAEGSESEQSKESFEKNNVRNSK